MANKKRARSDSFSNEESNAKRSKTQQNDQPTFQELTKALAERLDVDYETAAIYVKHSLSVKLDENTAITAPVSSKEEDSALIHISNDNSTIFFACLGGIVPGRTEVYDGELKTVMSKQQLARVKKRLDQQFNPKLSQEEHEIRQQQAAGPSNLDNTLDESSRYPDNPHGSLVGPEQNELEDIQVPPLPSASEVLHDGQPSSSLQQAQPYQSIRYPQNYVANTQHVHHGPLQGQYHAPQPQSSNVQGRGPSMGTSEDESSQVNTNSKGKGKARPKVHRVPSSDRIAFEDRDKLRGPPPQVPGTQISNAAAPHQNANQRHHPQNMTHPPQPSYSGNTTGGLLDNNSFYGAPSNASGSMHMGPHARYQIPADELAPSFRRQISYNSPAGMHRSLTDSGQPTYYRPRDVSSPLSRSMSAPIHTSPVAASRAYEASHIDYGNNTFPGQRQPQNEQAQEQHTFIEYKFADMVGSPSRGRGRGGGGKRGQKEAAPTQEHTRQVVVEEEEEEEEQAVQQGGNVLPVASEQYEGQQQQQQDVSQTPQNDLSGFCNFDDDSNNLPDLQQQQQHQQQLQPDVNRAPTPDAQPPPQIPFYLEQLLFPGPAQESRRRRVTAPPLDSDPYPNTRTLGHPHLQRSHQQPGNTAATQPLLDLTLNRLGQSQQQHQQHHQHQHQHQHQQHQQQQQQQQQFQAPRRSFSSTPAPVNTGIPAQASSSIIIPTLLPLNFPAPTSRSPSPFHVSPYTAPEYGHFEPDISASTSRTASAFGAGPVMAAATGPIIEMCTGAAGSAFVGAPHDEAQELPDDDFAAGYFSGLFGSPEFVDNE